MLASLRSSKGVARAWIAPWFGTRPISDITVEDVERFIAHLQTARGKRTGSRLSRASIAKVSKCLGSIFRHAQKRQMLNGANSYEQLDKRPTVGPGRDVKLASFVGTSPVQKLV